MFSLKWNNRKCESCAKSWNRIQDFETDETLEKFLFDHTCVGWTPPRPPKVAPLVLPPRPKRPVKVDPRPAVPDKDDQDDDR